VGLCLLAIPNQERLLRLLSVMLDEEEFLSDYGIRSLSKCHKDNPYAFEAGGQTYTVSYAPGESETLLFGGNSNWRGPIWFPTNYLIIEALERYDRYYGGSLKVEFPTGSGQSATLGQVAQDLARRLVSIFLPDAGGYRPCHGQESAYAENPHWRDLILFYEYFHGDDGRGVGASHQTGWTALVVKLMESLAKGSPIS
jgi:hypothetical protein